MPSRVAAPIVLLLPLLAASCHLVDQRDFDAAAGRPPVLPAPAAPPAPAPALVTIRYTTPDPQYREALAGAVHRALARKPDVQFTVITLVPDRSGPAGQAEQAAAAATSGRDVARAIVDDGAAAGQVEQAVRLQTGLAQREVQVTVH